ncbi:DNA replication initiation control protein YabA [Streptococcus pluranimalium]|uniref:DNA replication initiation control protein YabA n=1 Tax=Streptococcus pluranimalium TaxID=82348 RepID=UPI003139A77E
MAKKDLFDAFDGFSQNLMVTLAEIEAIKKQVQDLVEENTQLRLENNKLRERLTQVSEQHAEKNQHQAKQHLDTIYEDGFHICTYCYGQRRENDEQCAFCLELLYRE